MLAALTERINSSDSMKESCLRNEIFLSLLIRVRLRSSSSENSPSRQLLTGVPTIEAYNQFSPNLSCVQYSVLPSDRIDFAS